MINEKDSKFFNILIDINKINEPNSTIEDCQKEYNEFDKIFDNNLDIPFKILNKLEQHYSIDDKNFFKEMEDEIGILRGIFYKNEHYGHLEEIKKLFFIRLKKKFFIKQLENFINFINKYSNDENDKINIIDKIEKVKEKINEKDLTLNDVKKIYDEIGKIFYLISYYLYNSEKALLLEEIFKNNENFEFLYNKSNDEIRKLNEFIDETEESYININIFNSLLACVNFLNKLKNLRNEENNNKISFLRLNNKFNDLLKEDKANKANKTIVEKFKTINENFNYIKEFYLNILDKQNLNIIIVNEITENGIFEIDYNKIYKCECKLNNKKHLSLEKINELKETIQFNNDDEDKEKKLNLFVENILKINEIFNLICELNNLGYPHKLKIIIKLNKKEEECSYIFKNRSNKTTLNEIIKNLKEKKKSFEEKLFFYY